MFRILICLTIILSSFVSVGAQSIKLDRSKTSAAPYVEPDIKRVNAVIITYYWNDQKFTNGMKWYKNCAAFYKGNPSIDPDKVSCENVGMANITGNHCDVVDGNIQLDQCKDDVICSDCKDCEEFAGRVAKNGRVLIYCQMTSRGPVGQLAAKLDASTTDDRAVNRRH